MGALDDYLKSLDDENAKDAVDYDNMIAQNRLSTEAAIADVHARANSGAYNPPIKYLQDLATEGTHLFAVEDYVNKQAAMDASAVRTQAAQNESLFRNELAQRISDRRAKVNSAMQFAQRNYDDLKAEAPELEGLRNHFLIDPKTMSVEQIKKEFTPEQAEDIRDAEIADYFGIPKNLVREKRIGEAAALADAQYKMDQQKAAREGWDHDALKRKEEARVAGTKRLNDLTDAAENMPPVVWQYVNSPDGQKQWADDPNTLQAAKLAQAIHEYEMGPGAAIKNEQELSKFFQRKLIELSMMSDDALDDPLAYLNSPAFKAEDFKAIGDKLAARMQGRQLNEEAKRQKELADMHSGIMSTETTLTERAPTVKGKPAPTTTWDSVAKGAIIGAASDPAPQESAPISTAKFGNVKGGSSYARRGERGTAAPGLLNELGVKDALSEALYGKRTQRKDTRGPKKDKLAKQQMGRGRLADLFQ